jgi:hypothetical protein
MGYQYGDLMKDEINEEYKFMIKGLEDRGLTREQVSTTAREYSVVFSRRQKELFSGMAETSGLTTDDLNTLYYIGLTYYLITPPASSSCSYLAAWGNYTANGSVVVSRNWDLPDTLIPFTK